MKIISRTFICINSAIKRVNFDEFLNLISKRFQIDYLRIFDFLSPVIKMIIIEYGILFNLLTILFAQIQHISQKQINNLVIGIT